MNRLKRLSQISSAVSIAVGVGLAEEFTNWIVKFNLPPWFPHLTAVVIVVITFQALKHIFETILDISVTIRRLLLGHQFVEGTWLDMISHDGIPTFYGITRIVSSGASLRISGEDFDLDGKHTGYYYADMLIFEFPKIKYKYTGQRSDTHGSSQEGFGEFQFRERNGPPVKCTGCIFDLGDGKRKTFESWKVNDKNILKELDKPESDRATILQFFDSKLKLSTKPSA